MSSPIIEEPDRAEIMPIYRLSEGLSQNIMRKTAKQALDTLEDDKNNIETLPVSLSDEFGLMPLKEAFFEIHFPSSEEMLYRALQRLIVD